MTHKINPALLGLALPIETFATLPGNPREGDVDAIAASYDEFGQNSPIVYWATANEDGTHYILSGNHQLEAARDVLGWDEIAAIPFEGSLKHGKAFALAVNQSFERGSTNPTRLHEMLIEVYDDYADTFEVLGWDAFEMASMDEHYEELRDAAVERSTGYVPPVIQRPGEPYEAPAPEAAPIVTRTEAGTERLEAPAATNARDVATMGATASGAAGSKSIVQINIVFDSVEQQRRWYDFVRMLRSDPAIVGDTLAAKLMDFLESKADF